MSFYTILLEPTTSAATSLPFTLNQDVTFATLIVNGLATIETAILQIYDPISETFVDWKPAAAPGGNYLLLNGNGTTQLDATTNSITLGPVWGTFKVVKSVTAAAVGISVAQYITPRV